MCCTNLPALCALSDKKPRRVKKPHHLDEFESGFDDEMELSGLPRRSAIDRKRRLPPALEPRYAPGLHITAFTCLFVTSLSVTRNQLDAAKLYSWIHMLPLPERHQLIIYAWLSYIGTVGCGPWSLLSPWEHDHNNSWYGWHQH